MDLAQGCHRRRKPKHTERKTVRPEEGKTSDMYTGVAVIESSVDP